MTVPRIKRYSTWANIASIIAGALMTQSESLGLSDVGSAWLWVSCSIIVGLCQLKKQG